MNGSVGAGRPRHVRAALPAARSHAVRPIDGGVVIRIFGAGAIGGYLGIALAEGGVDVSLVARGAHLDAIRRDGLTLLRNDEATTLRLPAWTIRPRPGRRIM